MLGFTLEQVEGGMENASQHIPVMANEVRERLNLSAGGCFVDCTLGLGGHSSLIASVLGSQGRIIGIDRDKEALEIAKRSLSASNVQCTFVHDDFRNIDRILNGLGIEEVDGILLDLGVSSFQLDDPERGFSIKSEGPLDMRMDQDSFISAYDLINSLSEKEISSILREYGEERWHNRIARSLVSQRPIDTTTQLSDVVVRAIPARYRHQKIHPATRTFQAFRIVVNRELEALRIALDKCVPYMKRGARLCVIAFHSLEDRIVKQKFRMFAKTGELCLITKKPLYPEESEILQNPRSRSARLRVAERN